MQPGCTFGELMRPLIPSFPGREFQIVNVGRMTTAPWVPYKVQNASNAPLHYYCIEYKRIDGEDFKTQWQQWYPWAMYIRYMR